MPEPTIEPSTAAGSWIEGKDGVRVPRVAGVAANYAYWREHGGEWADEYDARKKDQIYYHVQELMLAEYMGRNAERLGGVRVLEFGCGVGRHLRYLSAIPGVEAHGYDQSETMVGEMRRWADEGFVRERVRVGMPTGRLPYADGSFDVVYTAEVLVHVRPEDLPGILGELVRVSRREVLHLETSPWHELVSGEHAGCWYHDLVEAYRGIGVVCERLEGGYSTHSPYRVMVGGQGPAFTWGPVTLGLYRRMEQDLLEGIRAARAGSAAAARAAELEAEREAIASRLEAERRAREGVEAEARRLMGEVEAAHAHASAVARAADERSGDEQRRVASLERELSAARARLAALSAKQQAFIRRARDAMGL